MEAKYVRESNSHYLVLPIKEVSGKDYQMPMLLQNKIPGLLPVHMQMVDGTIALYYEVTSFHSLSSCFEAEKLDMDMILNILLHISHAAEEVDRYLLQGKGIILHPDYVFVSTDREEICFCYHPGSSQRVSEELNCMARFILDHIDYEDRRCTSLAYSLFQESMKENVSVADFAKMALGYERDVLKEVPSAVKDGPSEEALSEFAAAEEKEKTQNIILADEEGEWKSSGLEIVMLGGFNAVLMAAFFWAMEVMKNYLLPGSIEMAAVTAGGLLCAATLVVIVEHVLVKRSRGWKLRRKKISDIQVWN